jgi:hypothetical protein
MIVNGDIQTNQVDELIVRSSTINQSLHGVNYSNGSSIPGNPDVGVILDKVTVVGGEATQPVTVTRSNGGMAYTVTDSSFDGAGTTLSVSGGSSTVDIDGNTTTNLRTDQTGFLITELYGYSTITVTDNTVSGEGGTGIDLELSSPDAIRRVDILRNAIDGVETGIFLNAKTAYLSSLPDSDSLNVSDNQIGMTTPLTAGGIVVQIGGNTIAGDVNADLTVSGNSVSTTVSTGAAAIWIRTISTPGASVSSNITALANTFTQSPFIFESDGAAVRSCLDLNADNIAANKNTGFNFVISTANGTVITIDGMEPGTQTGSAVLTFLLARNSFDGLVGSGSGFAGGTCG